MEFHTRLPSNALQSTPPPPRHRSNGQYTDRHPHNKAGGESTIEAALTRGLRAVGGKASSESRANHLQTLPPPRRASQLKLASPSDLPVLIMMTRHQST